MKKKLRVGIYGAFGHQIHYKLYDNKDAELVAACGVSDSFFSEVKKHCKNIILYSSLEKMLKDTSLDLISICSKKRSEQEKHIIMCLKAGKHVYAEKPAAFSEEGLERILLTAKENGCDSDILFPMNNGNYMTKSSFRKFWDSIISCLNEQMEEKTHITPHIFRHTYATNLYHSGIDEKKAQYFLGHSSIQITMDVYTHLDKHQLTDEIDKLNDYLEKEMLVKC